MIAKNINFAPVDYCKLILVIFSQLTFIMLTSLPFTSVLVSYCLEVLYFLFFPIVIGYLKRYDNTNLVFQVIIQELITSVIWVLGITNEFTNKTNILFILIGGVSITICWIQIGSLIKGFAHRNIISTFIKENKEIVIISIVFILSSIPVLDFVPYNDSACYYSWNIKYLSDVFDFTTVNVQWLMTINHFSNGYGLFALIGELFIPHSTVGVHVVNILLAVISIFCFGGVIREICESESSRNVALYTTVYAFSPFVLGLIGEINVDIPVMYFFIIFLYCYLKKYFYLTLITGWLFLFSKEPAVIYYCFFWGGVIVFDILKHRQLQIKKKYIIFLSPVIYWVITFITAKIIGVNFINNYIYIDGGDFNTFGFSLSNIILKLKELLFLNFNWIFLLFILMIIIHKKAMALIITKGRYYFPLFFCFIGFLLFQLFYITFQHPRYIVFGTVLLICIVIPLFIDTVKLPIKRAVIVIFAFLLFVQSFVTIDPVTIYFFERVNRENKGNNLVSMSYPHYYDDSCIYNREYSYYRKIIEYILEDFKYDEHTALVFPPAYSTGEQGDILFWDADRGRVVSYENKNSTSLNFLKDDEVNSPPYKRLLFIYPDWMEPDYDLIMSFGDYTKAFFYYRGFKVYCFEVRV